MIYGDLGLVEWFIWLVELWFESHASDIKITKAFDIYMYKWLSLSTINEF